MAGEGGKLGRKEKCAWRGGRFGCSVVGKGQTAKGIFQGGRRMTVEDMRVDVLRLCLEIIGGGET